MRDFNPKALQTLVTYVTWSMVICHQSYRTFPCGCFRFRTAVDYPSRDFARTPHHSTAKVDSAPHTPRLRMRVPISTLVQEDMVHWCLVHKPSQVTPQRRYKLFRPTALYCGTVYPPLSESADCEPPPPPPRGRCWPGILTADSAAVSWM